jgi:hypothetical protein
VDISYNVATVVAAGRRRRQCPETKLDRNKNENRGMRRGKRFQREMSATRVAGLLDGWYIGGVHTPVCTPRGCKSSSWSLSPRQRGRGGNAQRRNTTTATTIPTLAPTIGEAELSRQMALSGRRILVVVVVVE